VNLRREELTVFLGDLYAGRFPLSFGKDPRPKTGVYELVDRRTDRTYYGRNSLSVKPTDPRNPYGGYWMSLGNVMFIHGTAREIASELKDAGCISLAPLDAKHVYSILAKGSQVSIVQ
jgi:lipoprotein-anchoring transpeptidase ErfK/SrfK